MTDDGVPPGEEHDDSPWRPGAAVDFEHPPRRSFVDPRSAPGVGSTADRSSRTDGAPWTSRRSVLIGLGSIAMLVLVVAVGGAVVLVWGGDRAPNGAVDVLAAESRNEAPELSAVARDVGGNVTVEPGDSPLPPSEECHSQRLPRAIDPLWDTELSDAHHVVSPVTVGHDSVVAVVSADPPTAGGTASVSVVALDIGDGRERWRADLGSSSGPHEIVGIVDRRVIVRSAEGPDSERRRLFGFDEDTGELRWDRGFRGDWSAQVDETAGLVYVSVRRPAVSRSVDSEVELLDARDGDRVHIAAGALIGRDADGRPVTRLGDEVLATSPTDRDLLGVVIPSESPFAALGTDVVVASGNENELSLFAGEDDVRTVPLVGPPAIDPPGFVLALEPLGDASFLVTGGGSVHGAELVGNVAEIRWRLSGVVVESAATDRGRALLVATEGGADQRVIDSSTGRTIVDVELRPGSLATLALVSNGVIVQDDVDGDPFRVALDLDGRAVWSLAGSGAVAIGSGVVVTVEDADSTIRVAAAGDRIGTAPDPAECHPDASR